MTTGLALHPGILSRGVRIADGECWLTLSKPGRGGYAKWGGRLAHRVAYEYAFGAIEAGLQVGHACHDYAYGVGECGGGPCVHRLCVNPAHLTTQTASENVRAAGAADAGSVCAVKFRDGRCSAGHPVSESDVACGACSRARRRRWYDAQRSTPEGLAGWRRRDNAYKAARRRAADTP